MRRHVAIVGCRPPPAGGSLVLYARILDDVRAFVASLAGRKHAVTLVSGGADGVDSYATHGAANVITHRPDYATFGPKRAPLERNTLIVRDADEVHAWPAPWSRGTWDTVRKARAAGKPCTVHEVSP